MSKDKIPPLGLTPKYIWDSQRIGDILAAMQRYSYAEKVIPVEWVEELTELLKESKDE